MKSGLVLSVLVFVAISFFMFFSNQDWQNANLVDRDVDRVTQEVKSGVPSQLLDALSQLKDDIHKFGMYKDIFDQSEHTLVAIDNAKTWLKRKDGNLAKAYVAGIQNGNTLSDLPYVGAWWVISRYYPLLFVEIGILIWWVCLIVIFLTKDKKKSGFADVM